MDCKRAESLLNSYHEELLSSSEREELKRHLASCISCSRVEAELRSVHNELAGFFAAHSLPAGFKQEVLKAILTPAELTITRRRQLLAWASIAAAAVLGFTLILFGLTSDQTTQPAISEDVAAEESSSERTETESGRELRPGEAVVQKSREDEGRAVRRNIPSQLLNGKPVTEGELPRERLTERPEAPAPEPGKEGEGHGKASSTDNELLASPREAGAQRRGDGEPPERRPLVGRNGPARPRRPVEPGRSGESEEQRRKRQELAERARDGRLHNAEELKKLAPEERRKVASAIKECMEKGVQAPSALKVAQTVLRNGGDADDVRLALNALARAVNRGVPAVRFVGGLERALSNAPEGTDLERLLKRLGESLGNTGGRKTN